MTQNPYQPPADIKPWSSNPVNQPGYPPQPPGGYGAPPVQPLPQQHQGPSGPVPEGYGYQQTPPPAAQPQNYPPQNVPAPAGSDWGDVGDPGAGLGGDGDSPALHQLENRLIFWRPRGGITMGNKYQSPEQEEQMRVDLIVCDGPPIPAHVSGENGAQTPFAAGPKVAPFFIGNVMVNKVILDKLRDFADPINPNPKATCLARFVKTPPRGQGKPYNDLKQATEEDKVIARPIYARWDEIKSAGQAARPDQFGGAQAPAQQWPGSQAPSTYAPAGPPQQPPYPQPNQQQGQYPPAGYSQGGPVGPPQSYPPY